MEINRKQHQIGFFHIHSALNIDFDEKMNENQINSIENE